MAYFLKKSKIKKGIYLQIYESYYDPIRNQTVHKAYKPLGYLKALMESGIKDPIAYFQEEVNKLNQERKEVKRRAKEKLIGDVTPEKRIGYSLIKNINDALNIKPLMTLLQSQYNFDFSTYDLLAALVYARVVDPCSKYKTFHQVLPTFIEQYNFSESQMYSGLGFLGNEYQKIIEIYNHDIRKHYSLDTNKVYFDCTNFYFEIDKEDDFRKKGPSKENRKEPIIGLGLLLDNNQIPIGMKMFAGNQSEKPIIKEILNDLKQRNSITGRTIQVADKGLNTADNIVAALSNKDGYLFSKSVKTLSEVEKTWILLDKDYKEVCDKNGEVKYKIKSCIDEFPYTVKTDAGKNISIKIKEKRVVTLNMSLRKKQLLEIYKQVEKAKTLKASLAKRSEYGDCSKYVIFSSTNSKGEITDDKVVVTINQDAIDKQIKLAGYNLLVTSEIKMSDEDIYNTYHNLWRIEESFRLMKSYLDARPVFLQLEERIKGHFLICYISVLLIRILQFKILNNKHSTEELMDFFSQLRVVKCSNNNYINIAKSSSLITELSRKFNLPFDSYYLTNTQLKKVLSNKL